MIFGLSEWVPRATWICLAWILATSTIFTLPRLVEAVWNFGYLAVLAKASALGRALDPRCSTAMWSLTSAYMDTIGSMTRSSLCLTKAASGLSAIAPDLPKHRQNTTSNALKCQAHRSHTKDDGRKYRCICRDRHGCHIR